MKKLGLISTVLAISLLTGCGSSGGGYVPPTTPYEKVKTAFSGVEKSMKNNSSDRSYQASKLNKAGSDSVFNSLFALYTSEDNLGDVIEDLSYTQPPMIQFQCLKYAFDRIGNSYSFDTKYYDTVTGKVYIDFETGIEPEHLPEYEYNYSFELALAIDIDENDFITADVSFSITISKGQDSYHSYWYVAMGLDYNMDKENPTYSLTMLTNNDERELPYYDRCVYEYDFVEVNENKINEWRKFDLEAPTELIKDAQHQTFDSYINSGMPYRVGSFAWYKNHSFYKARNIDKEEVRKPQVARLFYELGLNATDIDKAPFANRQGTKNSVIKTMYTEFSNIFRKDIIYSLVTRDEDHSAPDTTPRYLKVVDYRGDQEMSEGVECFISEDKLLFVHLINNENGYAFESPFIPKINVLNKNEELIGEASIDNLELSVIIDGSLVSVSKDDKVTDIAKRYNTALLDMKVDLVNDKEVLDSKVIRLNCTPFANTIPGWPYEEIEEMGLKGLVPAITSDSYYASAEVYSYSKDPISCSIYLNAIDQNKYNQKLKEMGYGEVYKNPTYAIPDTTKKIVFTIGFDGEYLKIEQNNEFSCAYSQADKSIFSALNQDVLLPEGLVFNHPSYLPEMFDYYGVSSDVLAAFISKLSRNGWSENSDPYGYYKYYFDKDDTRYCINYENIGDYSIRFVYSTEDVPTSKFDRADLYVKGGTMLPFGGDVDGNLYIDFGFFANQQFYVVGYKGDQDSVILGYKEIYNKEELEGEYIVPGSGNNVLVVRDVDFRITIINENGINYLFCTVNGGGGGGGYVQEHYYSLVGVFNNWDAYTGNDLEFDSNTGIYTYKTSLFTNGNGFVIVEDHSWNRYYGFSDLADDYSEYLMEGETNGIVPITDFVATIQFKDGVITLTDLSIVR